MITLKFSIQAWRRWNSRSSIISISITSSTTFIRTAIHSYTKSIIFISSPPKNSLPFEASLLNRGKNPPKYQRFLNYIFGFIPIPCFDHSILIMMIWDLKRATFIDLILNEFDPETSYGSVVRFRWQQMDSQIGFPAWTSTGMFL